jgi:hypothetical protein
MGGEKIQCRVLKPKKGEGAIGDDYSKNRRDRQGWAKIS